MRAGRRSWIVLVVALTSCASAPSAMPAAKGERACRSPDGGYQVSYPRGWSEHACRFFDEEGADDEEAAIAVELVFERLGAYLRELETPAVETVERKELATSGRRAVRLILTATRDSPMIRPGTRTAEYAIDLGGTTLVLRTRGMSGPEHEHNTDVLDRMFFSLRLQ